MQIRVYDRKDGVIVETVLLQQAAERIAECNMVEVDHVRRGLLDGHCYRTVGFYYEITPESLANYKAAKLEAAYDRIAMQ